MTNKRIAEKGNRPVAAGIGVGVFTAILTSILLAMIIAVLIVNERVNEKIMYYFTFATQLIATLAGGFAAAKRTGGKYALVSGLTALVYCLILIGAGILFFDGGFRNLGTSVAAIVIGCAGSCTLCISGQGRRRIRKRVTR